MLAASDQISVLGDATRRAIFEMLADGPSSVVELSRRLPVTRPAVSQHLRVLKDAGLVTHQTAGTRHFYRLDPNGLAALRDYFSRFWQKALTDFKEAAERSHRENQKEKEEKWQRKKSN